MNDSAVGIVGLGIMGGAMAEVLAHSGRRVVGYDPFPQAIERLRAGGGNGLSSAAAVAAEVGILILSLPTSGALRDTVASLASGELRPDQPLLVIEASTLPLADKLYAREALEALGHTVLDCPISGTGVRIKERTWTIYCSGERTAYERAVTTLGAFTDKLPFLGQYGNGTRMKCVANHLVAIYNVACAESLNFSVQLGLDPEVVCDLLGSSPILGTGLMRRRMPQMVRRSYMPATMKLEVWEKDMHVIGDMAMAVNYPTPLFSACAPLYTAAMAQGYGQHDSSSVSEVFARMAGRAD
jgi:putative dehydrogenase